MRVSTENARVCNTCRKLKDKTEFSKNRGHKQGLEYECKPCVKARQKKYYKSLNRIDRPYAVYCLPKESYVGVTSRLAHRLSEHKGKHKRDIEGWFILQHIDDPEIASGLEQHLHDSGWQGKALRYASHCRIKEKIKREE